MGGENNNNQSNVISINNKPRTEVDLYLDSLGLWRKPIPKDGSCFYRAVSEQLFSTQAFYGHLQRAVEEKTTSRTCSFCSDSTSNTTDTTSVDVDLTFSLEDNEVCGTYTEIKLLSDIYRLNFFIYTGIDSIYSISKTGHEKQILLFFDGIHYDSVYPKSFPPEAALCQSVVYDILYRNVFEMPKEIEEAVNILRKQNKCKRVRSSKNLPNSSNDKRNNGVAALDSIVSSSRNDCENRKPSPPLPYRVAKALDPDIFRNVEFDNWQEAKRAEMLAKKLSEFQPGDKCQVVLEEEDHHDRTLTYHAHVQDVPENGGPVEVYIEELGKKCQVAYDCLRHLPMSSGGGGGSNNNNNNNNNCENPRERYHQYQQQYQTKNSRKCRKAVTMVVHMNGTSQLVSSNLTTSTKSKKNLPHNNNRPHPHQQQPKMFIQSKFNSTSSTRSIKLSRALNKFHKNLNMVDDSEEEQQQLLLPSSEGLNDNNNNNNNNPGLNLVNVDNIVCECQYCKQQLLFDQDFSNSEMLVTYPVPQISSSDENGTTTFLPANNIPQQPSFANANGIINDIGGANNDSLSVSVATVAADDNNLNLPFQQAQPIAVTSQITINPHIWIPYLERVSSSVNINVGVSQDPCGRDLPLSDMPTLRFFFNLGCEYYKAVNLLHGPPTPPPQQPPTTTNSSVNNNNHNNHNYINNNNNSCSSSSPVRYSSSTSTSTLAAAAPAALAGPIYYPAHHHTYTQQLYAMYPPQQNFSNMGQSQQQPPTPFIPCVAYMQNVQFAANTAATVSGVPPQ